MVKPVNKWIIKNSNTNRIYDLVKASQISGAEAYFLMTLNMYLGDDLRRKNWKNLPISIGELAKRNNAGEKTIRRFVKRLKELGLLVIWRTFTDNANRCNSYELTLEGAAAAADLKLYKEGSGQNDRSPRPK